MGSQRTSPRSPAPGRGSRCESRFGSCWLVNLLNLICWESDKSEAIDPWFLILIGVHITHEISIKLIREVINHQHRLQ